MIKKFGVFGCPANLHDTTGHQLDLVVPAIVVTIAGKVSFKALSPTAGVDRESTSDRLETAGVTPRLQTIGTNFEVF